MKWIKTTVYAIIAAAMATMTAVTTVQSRHNRDLRKQVDEQSRVIDSLLTIRRNYINVELNVTDRSTSKLYGTYNKGTINYPQERTYRLAIDSVGIKLK